MKYAMFDIDSLELNENGTGLSFRPRVEPIQNGLKKIHRFAEENHIQMLFSTCCSGRMIDRDMDDILYVPLEGNENSWAGRVNNFRMIYIAKKTFGIPEISGENAAYSSFKYNMNLPAVIREINADDWIVFGNGFDFCIDTTIRGLCLNGQKITLLNDMFVRGSLKYLKEDPEDYKNRLISEYIKMGVDVISSEEFFIKYSASAFSEPFSSVNIKKL